MESLPIESHLGEMKEVRGEPAERLIMIPFRDDLDRMIQLRMQLVPDLQDRLAAFLRANEDIFA